MTKISNLYSLTNFLNVDSSGRIGIGTTAPQRALHTVGQGAFDMTTAGVVIQDSDNIAQIVSYKQTGGTYHDLHLRGLALGIVINGTTGNVGIGQTSPGYKLDVNGAAKFQNEIWLNSASQSSLVFQQSDVNKFNIAYNTSTGYLQFYNYVAGSIGMVITNANNVGIGLINPQSQLHITGDMTFTEAGYATVRKHQIAHTHSDGSSVNNNIRFLVSDGGGTTAERFRINGLGNLLLGTTTDASNRLEVQGIANNWAISATAHSTASGSFGMIVRGGTNLNDVAFRVNNQANNVTYFTVNGQGNVGIGTTTPGFPLDIYTSGGSIARFDSGRTGGGGINISNSGGVRLYLGQANWLGTDGISTSNNAIALASAQAADILFVTNAANFTNGERMRITNGGNVGVGITSPAARLHVVGPVAISNYSQTWRKVMTVHGQAGGFNQVKVIFNKRDWGLLF
jgi:hypothetical protein